MYPMRTFTKSILFFALFFIQNNLFSQTSSLFVQDPRQGFRRGAGQIDSAAITVKPKGLYAEIGLYLTYSSKNTNLIGAKDTLEIQHYFSLPKDVLVSDSWLWFQDIIIRAKLIDRWTASTIYNQIVGLRQDPSILFKNSPTSYEYRIYPMAGNQTRRVKLTFLIPMRWENNKTYIELPVNMLLTGGIDPQLNVRIFENPNWKNPSLAQFSDFKFNNQTDSLGATLGGIINVSTLRSSGNLSIVYDSPVKNGIYVSRQPVTDNEGLYQMLVFPNQVVNFNTPGRNVLVAIDHNAANTNIQTATLFNNIKENLQALLTSKDSFNLIFSRLNPQPLSQNWFSAAQLDSVFKTLSSASISNISNLPTLLGNSLEYMNKKGGGRLVLLSSDASFANFNSSNELITELKKIRNPLPQMHILDYSNLNNYGFNVGGAWYYGNGYLYNNLTRQSGGKFLDVLNNNNFTDYTKQIMQGANGSYDNLELYTTLEDGYCHSRFAINEGANTYNSPILQVGKYRVKCLLELNCQAHMTEMILPKK
jgi:Vault protein inter-alpha-trypsin domain